VPAAAVIPAPIAYIKVVAVKKLVVEFRRRAPGLGSAVYWAAQIFLLGKRGALHWVPRGTRTITLRKIECSKQAFA
jgi:hypothetical protein